MGDLAAAGTEHGEFEDEERYGGRAEDDGVDLNQRKMREGDERAEEIGDSQCAVNEQAGRVEPDAAHGCECESDAEKADGEEAGDRPPGALRVDRAREIAEGPEGEEEGDGGEEGAPEHHVAARIGPA